MTGYDKLYIDGAWVEPAGTDKLEVIDATTEQVFATIPEGVPADIDRAVAAAKAAFPGWSEESASERGKLLRRVAEELEARRDEIADVITHEVGMPKPLSAAIQVGTGISAFTLASELLATYEFEDDRDGLVVREPIGVVGCITPWNYPLNQIGAKVAYVLAAGCTVVLKPSEVAPVNAFILAEIMDEIGFPAGVFNLVTGIGPVVGEALAAHPDVDMISFTGSTRAGKRVSELAAQNVKRVALELGGKSPNVLLDDADFSKAVAAGVGAAYANSGQTCSALTRMIVPRERLVEVEQLAKDAAESYTVGDPFAEGTRLGPLISAVQLERVRGYINKGIEEGATLVTGGPDAAGRPRGRLLRASDCVLQRHARHDDRAGGDLRTGAVDHAVRLRRGGDRDRQRHGVRARGRGVGERRARPPRGAQDPCRSGQGEQGARRQRGPVRRVQAVGPRARARPARSRGVPRGQSVDGLIRFRRQAGCERGDSNSHTFRYRDLNPARLPVPPRSRRPIFAGSVAPPRLFRYPNDVGVEL